MHVSATGLVTAAIVLLHPLSLEAQKPTGDGDVRLAPGDAVRLELLPSLSRAGSDRDPTRRFRAEFPEPARQPLQGEAEGTREFDVDAQGDVVLPVAGRVHVAGRPFVEVRTEVQQAFDAEFTEPAVRLTPLVRIAVLGEVRAPGLFRADPTMTFADLLAAAGGLTDLADRDDVRLMRADGTVILSEARDVVGVTLPMSSGDRIVVGHRSWLSANMPFVVGAGASVVASILTALIVR